ncbi:MAG: type II secretion system GspH family protein, partial [Phycisphaerales bacterium]|nr:type II secretion system GspH family protein [Phycisphaerales bacterium]
LGFTLVELMIAITIIALLGGIITAVGLSAQVNAKRRTTRVTLKALDVIMKEYIDAGNPEPIAPPPNDEAMQTTYWVKALRASPDIAKKLSGYVKDKDNSGVMVVFDSFGTPIKYVRATTVNSDGTGNIIKPGYFQSAGPNRAFENPGDDLFSTDPQ